MDNGNIKNIKLYPSNWFYNAIVLGFLISIEKIEKLNEFIQLNSDGSVEISPELFSNLDVHQRYFSKKISSIIGNNELYKNYLQSKEGAKERELFAKFVNEYLCKVKQGYYCDLCGNGYSLDEENVNKLSEEHKNSNFFDRIRNFSIVHNALLGPSKGEFPNSFWNITQSAKLCHLCGFFAIHFHLAFTPLPDGSEIFINAPSFEVIYWLNKHVQSLPEEGKNVKQLLGISLIEFSTKLKAQLGLWASMNIEAVIKDKYKKDNKIYLYFFSLPFEIVLLLNDYEIANLIREIGELKVLSAILDGNFNKLIEDAYKIMRILKKEVRNEADENFLNEYFRNSKNRSDERKREVVQNMLKLYALIENKIKGGKVW